MKRAKGRPASGRRYCWVIERYGARGWRTWEVHGTEDGAKASLREHRKNRSFEYRLEKYWSSRND